MPSARAPRCPPSDVSAAVGLVGAVALGGWVLICHLWPKIMDALALPGPRAPLSGPSAAFLGILIAALPMVVWSVLIDKVQRDPATGIDWAHPRPWGADRNTSATKLVGLWATWGMIAAFYCLGRWYWAGSWLFAMQVLELAALPMLVLSVPYVLWLDRVLVNPRDGAWHLGALLIGRGDYDPAEVRRHGIAWAVKGFFTAFMFSIVPGNWASVVGADWGGALASPVAVTNLLVNGFFLLDVQIGTVGYLLTVKPLAAQIRSGNPLLAGWVAALLCYPPFSLMTNGGPLDYHATAAEWSFWMNAWPALEWLWGGWLMALTAIYAWATVAFGIRFSNLTYRGVVTNGPYRFCRHPAYLAKNLFWWSSTLPFFATTHSLVDMLRNTALLGLVSAVYYWRGRTEEAHLLAEDPKYAAYHAWMAEHGAVTRRLAAAWRWLGGEAPEAKRRRPA